MKIEIIKNKGSLSFTVIGLSNQFSPNLFTPTREQIKALISHDFDIVTLFDGHLNAWLEIYHDLTAKVIANNLCCGIMQLEITFTESLRQESMLTDDEIEYIKGRNMAWLAMLQKCIAELGVFDDFSVAHTRWILERQESIIKLRTLCTEMESDNAWPNDSYLPHVLDNLIDKVKGELK